MSGTLTVIKDTYFKLESKDSTQLPPLKLYKAYQGQQFSYSFVDYENYPGQYNHHYKVHFSPALVNKYWPNGVQTWFVYQNHVRFDESISDEEASIGASQVSASAS